MKVCLKCNTINDDDATTCENCGAPLPIAMLAIVCPNCGKVCPLRTKECPVCHHPLTDIQPKKVTVNAPQSPRYNKKLLRWLAIISVILGAALFVYFSKTYTINQNFNKYEGLIVRTYDQSGTQRGQYCYVIQNQQHYKKSALNLNLAYTGTKVSAIQNQQTVRLKQIYKQKPHYQLQIRAKQTTITGPQKIVIQISGHKVMNTRKMDLNWPNEKVNGRQEDSTAIKARIIPVYSSETN